MPICGCRSSELLQVVVTDHEHPDIYKYIITFPNSSLVLLISDVSDR